MGSEMCIRDSGLPALRAGDVGCFRPFAIDILGDLVTLYDPVTLGSVILTQRTRVAATLPQPRATGACRLLVHY